MNLRVGPLTIQMIRYVDLRFMYVCDLERVWRPPTSYGVHIPFFRKNHCPQFPESYSL